MIGFIAEILGYLGRSLLLGLIDELIAHIRDRLRRLGPDRVDRPPRVGAPSRSGNIPAPRVPGHKAAHLAARRDRQPAARHLPRPRGNRQFAYGRKRASPGSVLRGTGRRTPPSYQRGRQSRHCLDSQQPMNRSARRLTGSHRQRARGRGEGPRTSSWCESDRAP